MKFTVWSHYLATLIAWTNFIDPGKRQGWAMLSVFSIKLFSCKLAIATAVIIDNFKSEIFAMIEIHIPRKDRYWTEQHEY